MGRHGARRRVPRHHRPRAALGQIGKLHRLRQVRPRLPYRRPFGKRKVRRGNVQAEAVPTVPDAHARGPPMSTTSKIRLATVWLDGCSGCHMSLLDTDERLVDLAQRAAVVWGPLVDAKKTTPQDNSTLDHTAISSEEDLHRIRLVRSRTKVLISLGDCA